MREQWRIFRLLQPVSPHREDTFSNLGMAYIAFAREERHLFELLFVSGDQGSKHKTKSMYEILNGDAGNVVYEINLARVAGCPDPGDLFMKMWILSMEPPACL